MSGYAADGRPRPILYQNTDVMCTVPNQEEPVRGTVRYVGKVADRAGLRFGIEFSEPV